MPEPFIVPADGPDLLQNFVLPINIPEDKLVAAIEIHAGDKRVVHHAVLFFLMTKVWLAGWIMRLRNPAIQTSVVPVFFPAEHSAAGLSATQFDDCLTTWGVT